MQSGSEVPRRLRATHTSPARRRKLLHTTAAATPSPSPQRERFSVYHHLLVAGRVPTPQRNTHTRARIRATAATRGVIRARAKKKSGGDVRGLVSVARKFSSSGVRICAVAWECDVSAGGLRCSHLIRVACKGTKHKDHWGNATAAVLLVLMTEASAERSETQSRHTPRQRGFFRSGVCTVRAG